MARVNPAAIPDFFQGEYASRRNAWARAERYYAQALARDSTFVLAAWRLGTARRWRPWTGDSPFPPNFFALYQAYGDNLPAVDQRLIKAQFASAGEARFAEYDTALAAAPDDPFAPLLYGDELFHRGPLAGHSLAEALGMLRESLARDSTMAPAWEHLAWAHIRMGRRDSARQALDTLRQVAGPAEEGEIHLPDLLQVAFGFRFPAGSQAPDPGPLRSPAVLPLAARGALAFDLPELQLELGRTLASLPKASPATRGNGQVAQGVALFSLGRPMAALAHFDSAAVLFDSDEARLQAAEWRVVPPALGSPGYSPVEVDHGRAMLATLMAEPALAARAGWALALDALSRGDTAGARGYQVGTNPTPRDGRPLALLLQAWQAAAAGRYDAALEISAPALAFDSAGAAPDPFLRSALHLKRGEWFQATQRPDLADRSWIWYEALDLVGWPHAEAQAGEVDWALGPWTRWRRGSLALSQGRRAEACAHFNRVLALWTGAEEGLAPLVKEVRDRGRGCSADE
jgi:tetratricopeptide (TPR) repeat protein